MSQKYELIKNDMIFSLSGTKLYRIRALKNVRPGVAAGDLGGYIQSEKNLSQTGRSWVYPESEVFDDAAVLDDAVVRDTTKIFGKAVICENAIIYGRAYMYGHVYVRGFSKFNY